MSVPSTGMTAMWRNSIEDIKRLLETRHPNTYMIFNLSESKYDYDIFDNQVCDSPSSSSSLSLLSPFYHEPSLLISNPQCRSWIFHFLTTTRPL